MDTRLTPPTRLLIVERVDVFQGSPIAIKFSDGNLHGLLYIVGYGMCGNCCFMSLWCMSSSYAVS